LCGQWGRILDAEPHGSAEQLDHPCKADGFLALSLKRPVPSVGEAYSIVVFVKWTDFGKEGAWKASQRVKRKAVDGENNKLDDCVKYESQGNVFVGEKGDRSLAVVLSQLEPAGRDLAVKMP